MAKGVSARRLTSDCDWFQTHSTKGTDYMKRFIGLSLFCLLSTAVLINVVSFAEDEPGKQAMNPFAGRIVTVYLNGPTLENGQILEDAEIKDIGGRKMIVGIGTDTGEKDNWT